MNKERLCQTNDCTLCMACVNVCPHKAIYLSTDENGYEKIVIDHKKCVDCGLCSKVCNRREEVSRNTPLISLAAQALEKDRLKNSASGGAFQMLALSVLENGGVCYGAEGLYVDGNYSVQHTRIDSKEDLERILNSKYVPSMIGYIYQRVKIDLESGRDVLFSGTPCQIQGLKAFLNKDYANLLTADLICHGVTSTKIFMDYIREVEKTEAITIVDYQFRDKSVSWGTNFCYSYYKNDDLKKRIKIKHCPREASSYMIHYLKGNIFRENCYNCSLSCIQRVSDFTLGDFWEIESEYSQFVTKSKPRIVLRQGVSCILVNTEKAKDHLQTLGSKMILHDVALESIVKHNGNLREPSKRGKDRDGLLETYRERSYEVIENQYRKTVLKKAPIYNLKNFLKSYLPDRVRILIYKTPLLRRIIFH